MGNCKKNQSGTGDAVRYAIPHLKGSQTIILYGDVPMIESYDLKELIKKNQKGLGILTFNKKSNRDFAKPKEIKTILENCRRKRL